jgi:hypothetical protein
MKLKRKHLLLKVEDGGGMSDLLELNNDETTETVMENRMAMYSARLASWVLIIQVLL